LRAVEYVERLAKIGVDSLKVEGHQKLVLRESHRAGVSPCD